MSASRTYQTEFSNFELDVPIPPGFCDSSWGNDACPSWSLELEGERAIRICVDYKNPERRDIPEIPRFSGTVGLCSVEPAGGNALQTDDWTEMLSWAETMVARERQRFIADRVIDCQREILKSVVMGKPFFDGGEVPTTALASFSELHDFCDANVLGGLCDENLNKIAEGLFPLRTDPGTLATQEWMEACNVIQNTVNAWIESGELRDSANEIAKLYEEQLECLFDPERADEAPGMLDDLQCRVGIFREGKIKELVDRLRERLQAIAAYPVPADSTQPAQTPSASV